MNKFLLCLGLFFGFQGFAQDGATPEIIKYTANNKGKFYVYWGGNRDAYTKSDIHFKGNGYNFTLHDVKAHDKPKGWHLDYINPARMTIPQTNLRIGYYLTNNYNISFGVDHMKYVMYNDKVVNYTGNYPDRGSFGEAVADGQVLLTEDFLKFEHTDGLNYVNVEVARTDDFSSLFGITDTDKIQVNSVVGVGAGLLYPKTNSTLMGKDRHDDFHVSGYGVSAKVGANITFLKYFFVQAELKGGYIDMNSIRTTNDSSDKASQDFYFGQTIIALGGIFRI